MDAGIEDETGVEMPGIERCSCPASYTGYSCEASISTHMSHAVVGFSWMKIEREFSRTLVIF